METGSGKELFIDGAVIDESVNAVTVFNPAVKPVRNPLLVQEKPWESCLDNLYPNIVYDGDDKVYKLWYEAWPFGGHRMLCYAVSKDGFVWDKPDLGMVEFDGSKHNNIVCRGVTGAGVAMDAHEKDGSRRYKMLYNLNQESGRVHSPVWSGFTELGLSVAFSEDGICWRPHDGNPLFPAKTVQADTHNNFFWDDDLKKFIGFTRKWHREQVEGRERARRDVARFESGDFIHWSEPETVFHAEEKDYPDIHYYSMPVFKYEGMYLGLLSVLHADRNVDTVNLYLAFSRDSIHWKMAGDEREFIPRGKPGEFDSHLIYGASSPVVEDDVIRFYYGGCDNRHTISPDCMRNTGLGLATLRRDGFVSLGAGNNREGMVITRPLAVTGDALTVNADGKDGEIKVSVLDKEMRSIKGFEEKDCDGIRDDAVRKTVNWGRDSVLGKLEGKAVRLKFVIRGGARVYAFQFEHK